MMRVIAKSTLINFWDKNPKYNDCKQPILAWHRHAVKANWKTPDDIKADFGNASILKDGRVVFNIAGNKYHLIVWINYDYSTIYIRFIGTHAEYDKIDAQTI